MEFLSKISRDGLTMELIEKKEQGEKDWIQVWKMSSIARLDNYIH